MNYEQSCRFIQSLSIRGIKPGLNTVRELCLRMGNPQDRIKTVHIAGTNGKGSVGAFISSILRTAGYKVGRYVSPAVEDPLEIIRINDEYIAQEEYANAVSCVCKASKDLCPTAFEAETAAAFYFFSNNSCDYAVIECGMGGLLDASNIILKPVGAVITSISIDHKAFLGGTIEEIAANKAGIIKPGCKVFCAVQDPAVFKVIADKCEKEEAELITAVEPVIFNENIFGTQFDYRGHKNLSITLPGVYQPSNAALAIDVCAELGVCEADIRKGLRDTKWAFRFEYDHDGWIYDGAHNPDAALKLRESIDALLKGKRLAFIVGVFKDKDYAEIIRITASAAEAIYTVKPPSRRGLDSGILANEARKYCRNVIDAGTADRAVKLSGQAGYDNIVVFGSLSFLSCIKHEKEAFYGEMSKDN